MAVLLLAGAVFAAAIAGTEEQAEAKPKPGTKASATTKKGTTTKAPAATKAVTKKTSSKKAPAAKSASARSTTTKSTASKPAETKAAAKKASATKPPSAAVAPAAAPSPAAASVPTAGGGIMKMSFPVKGMVCMLCTRGVEEAIKRLPGVATVTADLATGRVDVVAQERRSLDIQQVRDRSARAGFPVSGETDVEARGRFEVGVARRLSFRPAGGVHAWQVLESARLLALTRAYPALRGDFVLGFRLHEKPTWKRTAISITTFESAVPVQRAAGGP